MDTDFALEMMRSDTDRDAISNDNASAEGIKVSGFDHFEIAIRIPPNAATTLPIATIGPVEAFFVNAEVPSIKENIPIKADKHAVAGLIDSGSQKDNRTSEPVKVAITAAKAAIDFQLPFPVALLKSIMMSTKPMSLARTVMP